MSQTLDPLIDDSADGVLLCCYVNAASKVQIARITNVENWYFERVVFPGQRLMFNAPPEAQLEIHTGMMASSIMSDSISCSRLTIDESEVPLNVPFQPDAGVAAMTGPASAAPAAA